MEFRLARLTQLLRRNYTSVLLVVLLWGGMVKGSQGFNYRDALERALVFYEGQRSGALPALTDGNEFSVWFNKLGPLFNPFNVEAVRFPVFLSSRFVE
jgi:hypothetical protein